MLHLYYVEIMEREKTDKRIKKYWLKDLTYKEIGLLVGLSERTIKREIKRMGVEDPTRNKPLSIKAYELSTRGYSLTEIAKLLGIGRSTAFLYVKTEREKLKK